MATRSLIGVLEPGGNTFQSRYCHSDGNPTYQLLALASALHDHHDGDLDRLGRGILCHDWEFIAAEEATDATAAQVTSTSHPAPRGGKQPVSGIGYRLDADFGVNTGTLDAEIDGMIEWLYLLTADQVRVFRAGEQHWELFGEFSVDDLTTLDAADLARRETQSESEPAAGGLWTVFVRFADQRITKRLMPDGHTTRRRVHAAQIATADRATQVAAECQTYLDQHHPGSRAWPAPF